jgi:hypothetical protein
MAAQQPGDERTLALTHNAGDSDNQPAKGKVPVAKGTRVRGGDSVAWARARAAEALAKRQSTQEAIVLQQVLPLWNEEVRGVPNPMIRSGLFGTRTSRQRHYFEDENVVSLSNFTILYTGKELQQDDLSVWMALINIAARQRIGDAIFFSGYEIVKDLGWRMHSESYDRAKESIKRLKANELKIQVRDGSSGYAGSLIREYAWKAENPEGGNSWMVRFEPMIAELFREDSTTFITWEQRKEIGPRATLTLWLHSYYTSHRDPFPITLQKLHELCRSEQKDLRFFRRRVQNSLDRLKEIGFLEWFEIKGDTVHVKKAPVRLPNLKAAATRRLV